MQSDIEVYGTKAQNIHLSDVILIGDAYTAYITRVDDYSEKIAELQVAVENGEINSENILDYDDEIVEVYRVLIQEHNSLVDVLAQYGEQY